MVSTDNFSFLTKIICHRNFGNEFAFTHSKDLAHSSLSQIFGARWRSGRASDSESRGPGFDPRMRHRVVSLSKTHLLPTVLVKPRKSWLRPDMTEKLLTGTLSLNTNKQTDI